MCKCYICGNKFDDKTTKKHDEHIIQQAIGGSLTADHILCESCGGSLGNDIDVPFSKIFSGISARLDIKTDRGGNKKPSTKGRYKIDCDKYGIEIDEIDVFWSDFKVSPATPFHKYTKNKDKVIIYANKRTADHYKAKVIKELEEFDGDGKPEIIICDDLEGVVNFPFSIDTRSFSRGLAKIAIGFASKRGIPRECMHLALEINKATNTAKILDNQRLIQFYPLGIVDFMIEAQKHNLSHYPYHSIVLFTLPNGSKKILACYIELFSTFQWYIVLSDNYEGEKIYDYYAQETTKKDDYEFTPGTRYYKEREMIMMELGITKERLDGYKNKHKNKKSPEELEVELMQQEYIKQKYNFDFEDYISSTIKYISNHFLASKIMRKMKSEDVMDFHKNMKYFLYLDENDNEEFSIINYRRFYFKNNSRRCYLSDLNLGFATPDLKNSLRWYGHMKMNNLNLHMQIKSINSKT